MQFTETKLKGAFILGLEPQPDQRGFLLVLSVYRNLLLERQYYQTRIYNITLPGLFGINRNCRDMIAAYCQRQLDCPLYG